MKQLTTTLFILFITITLSAQSYSVRGRVSVKESQEFLAGANVLLYHLPDSAMKGTTTDNNGRFIIENIKEGKYSLVIRFIGYKSHTENFEIQNRSLSLGNIQLEVGELETKEVKVVESAIPVVQKADTTEFSAQAFKTNKDADAENLVTKMPGISMQDGKVQAHGEEVKKVLVDGKQFFGDDPTAVLKNIPAEIVERIQVYDEQSEQSQFTGFDDGNTNKTINIVTRFRNIKGTFGKLIAGYGDQEKYKSVGNVNFFDGDRRLTLLGQINNVNEQNFSIEDLVGSMPGGSQMAARFSMMRAGGFSGGRRSGGISDFLVNAKNGLTDTKAFGLNYSNKWGKELELSGSYFFNLTNNNAISDLTRQYFLSENQLQNYTENSIAGSDNLNHRFNLRVEYDIDTLNSILFRPRLTLQQNQGKSTIFGSTTKDGNDINNQSSFFNSDLTAINSSAELLIRHKFETKRRTVSLSINPSYNKNNGDNKLYSLNEYFIPMTGIAQEIIDQESNLNNEGFGISSNFVYTEPLFDNGMLQFTGNFSSSTDDSDQKTFSPNPDNTVYNILADSLSNVYKKTYLTRSIGGGYRYQKDELSFNANINYNIATLKNTQTFPFEDKTEKTFYTFLPSFQMRYNISRDKNFRLFFRTSNNSPSVEQLQNVLNNSNPQQLYLGNPNLKQDYRTNLNFRYMAADVPNMTSFFIMFSGTLTNNYIGYKTISAANDTLIDGYTINRGIQLRRPANLDGYVNVFSFLTYGLPVTFLHSNLNLNGGVNFSRTPSIVNNENNFANTWRYSLGFTISSNFSTDIDISLSSMSTYNVINNTIQKTSDNNYFNQNTRLKVYLLFWESLVLQSDLTNIFNNGLSDTYNNNYLLWNLSIGYKIFSKGQGEIRFSAIDLLNQNTNIQRNTSDYYVEDSRSNVLGRYFLLSFIYNLRAF